MSEPSFLSVAQSSAMSVSLGSPFNTRLCSCKKAAHLCPYLEPIFGSLSHDLPSQDTKLVNYGHRVLTARGLARKAPIGVLDGKYESTGQN
jgi:hypothetical protein